MHVDDLADAVVHIIENDENEDMGKLANMGTARYVTIQELAEKVMGIVGFEGGALWVYLSQMEHPESF